MTRTPRTAVAVLTAALALLLPTAAASAEPDCPPVNPGLDPGEPPDGVVPFLGAADPVCAAIAWSEATWPRGDDRDLGSTAGVVFLARADVFADSLASGAVQSRGPLLLTPPDALDPRVADELARLAPEQVVVLGGEGAVSQEVIDGLAADGHDVDRVGGDTRTDTAVGLAGLSPDATTAVVVRGYGDDRAGSSWADSLSIGGWASSVGAPVLLTDGAGLPTAVRAYLRSSQVEEVVVVGGTDAVPDGVLADLRGLGLSVSRVAGADRFSTAVAVATDLWGHPGAADAERSLLVEATQQDAWASGVAAAGYAAKWGAPILLSTADGLPAVTAAWLGDSGCEQVEGTGAAVCLPPSPQRQPSPERQPPDRVRSLR